MQKTTVATIPRTESMLEDTKVMKTNETTSASEKTSVVTLNQELEAQEEKAASVVDIPDGGWKAWSVLFGVWIIQFCTFGYTNAYGAYNDFYVREYLNENYTSSQISWIGSMQLFLVLSFGFLAGRGFDIGFFYHLMIGGSLLFGFCLFMLSLSKPEQFYQVFLAQGLGVGIAIGLTYVPGLAVLSHYFHHHRALVMGIATSGSAVGGALHPIMLNKLFHGSLGFHSGVRASAGLNLGLLLFALLLVHPRLPPKGVHSSLFSTMRVFSKDVPYMVMILGTVLAYTGLYFPIFFIQLNAIKNGVEPNLAFYTVAILNAGSTIGRIVPNFIVRYTGLFNMIIPCLAITAILVFCTFVVHDLASTMVFAILYGFFSGCYAGLVAPTISSLAKTDSEIGARMGICFTFTGIGGLIGTPIAGALLTTSFIWWRPILFSGLSVTCGSLCFCVARYMIAKEKGIQKL